MDPHVECERHAVANLGFAFADFSDVHAARIHANRAAARRAPQKLVAGALDALFAGAVGLVVVEVFQLLVVVLLGVTDVAQHVRGERAVRILAHRRDDEVGAGQIARAFGKCRDNVRWQIFPHRHRDRPAALIMNPYVPVGQGDRQMQRRAECRKVHLGNLDDVRLLRDACELVEVEDDVVAGPVVSEHDTIAVHDFAARGRDADAPEGLRFFPAVIPATVKDLNAEQIGDE